MGFNAYQKKKFVVLNPQPPEFQMISTNDVEMFIDETIHLHGLIVTRYVLTIIPYNSPSSSQAISPGQ